MNNQRRKEIKVTVGSIKEHLEYLKNIAEEELQAMENLPESLQYGEKGEAMQENSDRIDEVSDEVESQLEELLEL